MSRISDLTTRIAQYRETLKISLETVKLNAKGAIQAKKRSAADKIPDLIKDLQEFVIPAHLIAVFATGDKMAISKTAELLLNNEGVILNASKMYNDIVKLIEPSYGANRKFGVTQYSLMVQAISDFAHDFGYQEIAPPKFVQKYCKDSQDTFDHVVTTLKECGVGPQLNKDVLTRQILDDIIARKIDSKLIPVLVTNPVTEIEGSMLHGLFSKSTDCIFPADFEPTASKVTAIFKGKTITAGDPNDG